MGIFIGDHHFFQITEDSLLGSAHLYGQEFLLFTTVDRQDPVTCHFGYRLFVAVVILIDRLGFSSRAVEMSVPSFIVRSRIWIR